MLDRLEADVAEVERALTAQNPPSPSAVAAASLRTWVPPSGLGPLPERLLGRARELAAAQARVSECLEAIRTTTVHHLSALRTPPTPTPGAPIFVDVRG